MEAKLQLKVNGRSYEHGPSMKITDITQEEYDKLYPLMRAIISTKKNNIRNFNRRKSLKYNHSILEPKWEEVYDVKELYPVFKKEIDLLMDRVPRYIDGIESFELIETKLISELS